MLYFIHRNRALLQGLGGFFYSHVKFVKRSKKFQENMNYSTKLIDAVKSLLQKEEKTFLQSVKQINDLNNNKELVHEGMKFALTGSRFFNNKKGIDTDYDFFSPYSEDTIKFLTREGFEKIYSTSTEYKDSDVKEVYRYKKDTFQIDIQLVKDYGRRLVIRDLLKSMALPWANIPKNTRSRIWEVAYILSMLPSPVSMKDCTSQDN